MSKMSKMSRMIILATGQGKRLLPMGPSRKMINWPYVNKLSKMITLIILAEILLNILYITLYFLRKMLNVIKVIILLT